MIDRHLRSLNPKPGVAVTAGTFKMLAAMGGPLLIMVLKILLRLLRCGGDPGTCSSDVSVISRNCSGNAAARIGGLVV